MTQFISWDEWKALRESNARKRAVRSALLGTGPDLPGSYAACPSTNPVAMNVAKKKGKVTKLENHIARPDYSLDRWLDAAQELGDDVNALVNKAQDDEKKLDKEKTSKKDQKDFEPKTQEQKDSWKKFKELHKEREKKDADKKSVKKEKTSTKPSEKSSNSSGT